MSAAVSSAYRSTDGRPAQTRRILPSWLFISSSVDYAGLFHIRTSSGRGRRIVLKGYICIFVCFLAVYIEVVRELLTEAFLTAFRRFVGRRGHVTDIHSDNGPNFSTWHLLKKQVPSTILHLFPPDTPHFNELAESGVKTMRKNLLRTVGTVL